MARTQLWRKRKKRICVCVKSSTNAKNSFRCFTVWLGNLRLTWTELERPRLLRSLLPTRRKRRRRRGILAAKKMMMTMMKTTTTTKRNPPPSRKMKRVEKNRHLESEGITPAMMTKRSLPSTSMATMETNPVIAAAEAALVLAGARSGKAASTLAAAPFAAIPCTLEEIRSARGLDTRSVEIRFIQNDRCVTMAPASFPDSLCNPYRQVSRVFQEKSSSWTTKKKTHKARTTTPSLTTRTASPTTMRGRWVLDPPHLVRLVVAWSLDQEGEIPDDRAKPLRHPNKPMPSNLKEAVAAAPRLDLVDRPCPEKSTCRAMNWKTRPMPTLVRIHCS
mmetsp:Transcript_8399/g.13357  ORF Transcript_8399/g.13357 Transcript_8399/m.13357 type:complete len:333 (-) Transcript_8399:708-1706(-)